MASTTVFPPIIDSFMPAFTIDSKGDGTVIIKFKLSNYNSLEDINKDFIQVSVRYLTSNISALNSSDYPNDIILNQPITILGNGTFQISFNQSVLESSGWYVDTYYKVQLRFYEKSVLTINNKDYNQWLATEGQNQISEWSTVCLIRPIPKFDSIICLNNQQLSPAIAKNVIKDKIYSIYSSLRFITSIKEKNLITPEELQCYQIKITQNETVILNSDIIYNNVIDYKLNKTVPLNRECKIEITYTTTHQCTYTTHYYFKVQKSDEDSSLKNNISLTVNDNADKARMELAIAAITTSITDVTLIVRRASSLQNFTDWEDIHIANINVLTNEGYIWNDYTVESGVWYSYELVVKQGDKMAFIGGIDNGVEPSIVMFEHIYLNEGGRQLCVKYNPSVSSMKYNIAENKTDTIGSQYPFIRRNGDMYYRTFPINGLITFLSDEDEKFNSLYYPIIGDGHVHTEVNTIEENLFISKSELFKNSLNYYNNYNNKYHITKYNDILFEKAFRNKVIEWLQNGKIKLFRSTTEGNILVRLTDVNLSPNETLGRYVYSFSCQANEIDTVTAEKCDKYNIQIIGTELEQASSFVTQTYHTIGCIHVERTTTNIISLIRDQLRSRDDSLSVNLVGFHSLRIEINDEPNVYIINSKELGYTIAVNNEAFNINKDGIYEFRNDNDIFTFSSLTVNYNANITYIAEVEILNSVAATSLPLGAVQSMAHSTRTNINEDIQVGSINKTFAASENIITQIKNLYNGTVIRLTIEANEGAEIVINNNHYTINDTELLDISEDNITNCYFINEIPALINYEVIVV